MATNKFRPNKYAHTQKLNQLIDILREYHRDLGILTPKVSEHFELIHKGSVLMGQQPVVFGGPGFIGNKLGCLVHLHRLIEESNQQLAPIFFIGDYDGLQKELSRQYFPNPISQNAFILDSNGYLPEESDIAAHAAELPPYEWLQDSLERLEENLHGFRSLLKGEKKKLLDERWTHIQTIIKSSFSSSETLSDWGVRIWGHLTNIIDDHGVIFLPTSHPEIRELIAPEYYRFLDNRSLYTEKFQEAMDMVTQMGVEPTLPHRHDDYAPFMIECEDDDNRVTTTIVERNGKLFAEGECPACDETISYDVTSEEALQKIATKIGPRVDTSQAVFQDLLNIRLRISGPGEIAYYAQAAPAVKAIGFDLPIFVKYKRAFYNGTWIEKLGKQLQNRDQGSLQQGELFNILRKRMDAVKNENPENIREAEREMKLFIESQYQKLLGSQNSNDVQKYLGWQFGYFDEGKFGQEVSWNWLDMALQTGLDDYIATYTRMYTPHSHLGGYYFINSQL